MASLIHQDTFEPYYAGREKDIERRGEPRAPSKPQDTAAEGEIVLPEEAPPHIPPVRRERRATAH